MADTVQVTIDRSSVAMGDDVESHREFWIFPTDATVDDLLVAISSSYLPGVAGPAGWHVDVNSDDQSRRRDLGSIYTRDDLRQEDQICRSTRATTTLGDLAQWAKATELDVYAHYLSGGQPLTLSEVKGGSTCTGRQPTKLESEAAADAKRDWVLSRELDRRAAALTTARRDWISNNIVWAAPPPQGSEAFIARNFHFLADLHCPASMNVAAKLLGAEEDKYQGFEALFDANHDRPAAVILAMVLGAFEWNIASRSWQGDVRPHCKPYFDFLASCGYRLSPIEEVLAGHRSVQEFRLSAGDNARLHRIRQLRDQQYRLRMGRYYEKTVSDDEYQSAIHRVHAELSALGELPGPR